METFIDVTSLLTYIFNTVGYRKNISSGTLTNGEAVVQIADELARARVDEPRLEAEILLANVIHQNRAQVLAEWKQPISSEQFTVLKRLAVRRTFREPLSYIIGSREFYGLSFSVQSGVLIPRPETETIVEEVISIVHKIDSGESTIADIGCGSGAIAIALAVNLPKARIYAIDNEPIPLTVSVENAHRHRVEKRITFLQGDLMDPLTDCVDILVANLPYISSGEFDDIQPEILWEPRNALDGGPDGLEIIRRIMDQIPGKVRNGGVILLECDPRQSKKIVREWKDRFPHTSVKIIQDLAGLDRVVQIFF